MSKKYECPSCGNEVGEYPAISRVDNKTEICSQCGVAEALNDYLGFKREEVLAQIQQIDDAFNKINEGRKSVGR